MIFCMASSLSFISGSFSDIQTLKKEKLEQKATNLWQFSVDFNKYLFYFKFNNQTLEPDYVTCIEENYPCLPIYLPIERFPFTLKKA